jgi:chaperonin GroEL
MAKVLLHNGEARRAMATGVAKLAAAVESTLGPNGMNAVIDRPIGTPLISRDGVGIASEIELPDRLENMGAQVAREVSMQTNEAVGDGTTTAMVLANGMVQSGIDLIEGEVKAVDLAKGIDAAVQAVTAALKTTATPIESREQVEDVATIAANDRELGRLVAEAIARVGADGVIVPDYGVTVDSTLDVTEGMSFDRGYISHHMVTDVERMECVLERPYILLTDYKITQPSQIEHIRREVAATGRPLLIVAEEIAREVVVSLLSDDSRLGKGKVAAVHPPDYGHWRRAILDDMAILLGGKVIARDLGLALENTRIEDLGGADKVVVGGQDTVITRGDGDPEAIKARRAQIQRQYEKAPPNIEQDKLRERLAKLTGGTAVIYGGGATPAEQKRIVQLIEDSLHATRAALEDGVVPGGGTALAQSMPELADLLGESQGGTREGVRLVHDVLTRPLAVIAENAGYDSEEVVKRVVQSPRGTGFNARTGNYTEMVPDGVMDPVKVTCAALVNAASIVNLILSTHTLIADLPEHYDPTAGAALGGGAEHLGRA